METEFISIEEAADLLGVGDSTVRRWLRRDHDPLSYVKFGEANSVIRINKNVLMEFVARHVVHSDATAEKEE
jgi:excisionase family DNA binding protein